MENRKYKSVTDGILINEFIIETVRINHKPLAIQQNDASVCYDRIIASHASLNGRREGTPKNVCILRTNTLQSTQYHVQTALGTSNDYSYHDKDHINRTCQDSGSEGDELKYISVPIIKTVEETSHGWYSLDPNGKANEAPIW